MAVEVYDGCSMSHVIAHSCHFCGSALYARNTAQLTIQRLVMSHRVLLWLLYSTHRLIFHSIKRSHHVVVHSAAFLPPRKVAVS